MCVVVVVSWGTSVRKHHVKNSSVLKSQRRQKERLTTMVGREKAKASVEVAQKAAAMARLRSIMIVVVVEEE